MEQNREVRFKAGMTLDEYLTRLHAEGKQDEESEEESEIQVVERFEIRETDEDEEDEKDEKDDKEKPKEENTKVEEGGLQVDYTEPAEKVPVADYSHTERAPYCFNLRLSQVHQERPIHELMPRKNFRVTKKGTSQSPQKSSIPHKGLDLFRSLYGTQFKQPQPKRAINLHGTLYSKSIFPRIDQRQDFRKPASLSKRNSKNDQAEFLLQQHLISTRQLLKLRGLPTEGPPHGVQIRIDGVKDKYYERKSKSKSIKRY